MSRPSITTLPSLAERALALAHHLAHLGWRATTGTSLSIAGLADRRRHVAAVDEDAAVLVELDRSRARARRARRPSSSATPRAARARSARGTSRPCRGSGSRAARRAAARPCSCRPRRARRWRRSSGVVARSESSRSKKPGKLTATASAPSTSHPLPRDEPGDRAEHRDPVVAAGVDGAAAPEPRRDAADARSRPAVAADVGAERCAAPSTTASIRSVSFARSSSAPRTRCRRARMHGEQGEERQLVDQQRHLGRADRRRRRARTAGSRGRRPARRRSRRRLKTVMLRAHPLEHVEQAGAARVQADAVDRQLRAGEQRRGDDERRRRGEVARDLDLAELAAAPPARP